MKALRINKRTIARYYIQDGVLHYATDLPPSLVIDLIKAAEPDEQIKSCLPFIPGMEFRKAVNTAAAYAIVKNGSIQVINGRYEIYWLKSIAIQKAKNQQIVKGTFNY